MYYIATFYDNKCYSVFPNWRNFRQYNKRYPKSKIEKLIKVKKKIFRINIERSLEEFKLEDKNLIFFNKKVFFTCFG